MGTGRFSTGQPNGAQIMTKTETRQPSFDINDPAFQRILAEAVAARMAAEKKASTTGGADKAIVAAFHKAGYKVVTLFDRTKLLSEQPDCNVLTYARWMSVGRKVKAGEKSIKVRGYHLRLFHKDQTEIASTAERKAYFAKQTAKADAKAEQQPSA
jgi:hypothetical protein